MLCSAFHLPFETGAHARTGSDTFFSSSSVKSVAVRVVVCVVGVVMMNDSHTLDNPQQQQQDHRGPSFSSLLTAPLCNA
jgi:hypothetical protein